MTAPLFDPLNTTVPPDGGYDARRGQIFTPGDPPIDPNPAGPLTTDRVFALTPKEIA